jgi:arylsulfatase A-like enzyme
MKLKLPELNDKGGVSRRDAMHLGLAGALAAATGRVEAARTAPKPNIVFILADDLGYADLSCYGRRDYRTPNIDSLATSGVRFLQGYANSAVCSATRTALITGRYQYRLPIGLEEPFVGPMSPPVGLPPEHPTLPSLLRKQGYDTALIGKWHLGGLPKYGPLQSGYDHFYGFRGGALDYFSHKAGGNEDLWRDDARISEPGYLTEMLGRQAERFIAASAEANRPFFLSLHFNAPHWPWEGPTDAAESIRIARAPLQHFDGGSNKVYGEMVRAMDAEVGRVLGALQRHGLRDDTIVIFTSDNGGERFADTWPFSGQKTELLEGGIRVPAIISWPRKLARNVTNDQVMISMDWLPTLLAAAGGAPDPGYPSDGIDLLPALKGAAPKARRLFWRYKSNHQRAMRDGDMKYLKILDNSFLFDVVADPLERANMKERQSALYARMLRDWQAWNMTMLPEIDASYTDGVTGADQADHIGARKVDGRADNSDLTVAEPAHRGSAPGSE